MDTGLFPSLFDELGIPVVVCRDEAALPVAYMNKQATLMFFPSKSVGQRQGTFESFGELPGFLRFSTAEELAAMVRQLAATGVVEGLLCDAVTFDGTLLGVSLTANCVEQDGVRYVVFYLLNQCGEGGGADELESRLAGIINAAILRSQVDNSIQTVLAMAGAAVAASRVYIFEEVSPTMTRNTYEWCAEGVEPAIQDLQNLARDDYPYDIIVASGMFITDDVRTLPDGDRQVLEMQGIKSLAIITIYSHDEPMGYVGFDDTERYRVWSHREVQFLKSVSVFLANLMVRRNLEQQARRSREVLQLVTDSVDAIIYANTLDDYRLVFTSTAMQRALGMTEQALLEKKCYEVLRVDQHEPCAYCPIPRIKLGEDQTSSEPYVWENYIDRTLKTYLAKDSIIRWVDGRLVHLEVAVDISHRIEYEEKLRFYASTDAMTGVYNREWGGTQLELRLAASAGGESLCFVDLDGLKKVNDSYGHAVGDEFISEMVRLIRARMEPEEFICRWGGDEFLLLLERPPEAAHTLMRRIQQDMEAYNAREQRLYRLSFSYGVVPFGPADASDSLDALVTLADKYMYEDKMKKRGVSTSRRRSDKPDGL